MISPGFDDGMIRLRGLPFLEEEPPHEFELLTARDVMVRPTTTAATRTAASSLVSLPMHRCIAQARNIVVLKEVELVGDVYAVLKRTRHGGFPVIDVGRQQRCDEFIRRMSLEDE